jgi:tetratricopeptide (TPR) repeat protein
LAARGEIDRAIYCWKRVLELDPDAVGVNQRIAQAYRAQKKPVEAQEHYLRELRDDPGNTDLLYEMAEIAMESGDVAAAAAKLAQIIELEPDHDQALFALAKTWLVRQDGAQALALLEKVKGGSDTPPELPGFEQTLGEALLLVGRFPEAREQLEAAVEKETEPVRALLLLGACLLGLEKSELAADAFRRVLARDERNYVAHQQLAVCLMRSGKVEAGVRHGLAALEASPNFTAAMSVTAYGYLRQGRWNEARLMLRRSLGEKATPGDIKQLNVQIWKYRLRHCWRKLVRFFGFSPKSK